MRESFAGDLAAVGITNQRETTVVWERKTGKAIANAIVWQDTRVAEEVARFAARRRAKSFSGSTGLPLSTYFSGLKMRWILENVPAREQKPAAGELLLGTIDTFLVWNLTGGPSGRSARHGRDQCQPHTALEFENVGMGSGIAGGIRNSAQACCQK